MGDVHVQGQKTQWEQHGNNTDSSAIKWKMIKAHRIRDKLTNSQQQKVLTHSLC